jgi:hypothetical protein
MTQPSENSLSQQSVRRSSISRVAPKTSPTLIEAWVVWEYTACLSTNGLQFSTTDLHDALKTEIERQSLPVNIFYASDACWIIEGARGRAKVDDDRRPRVALNLRDSRYTDMQFIAGIDYFGGLWANFQMMMIVQPEELEKPPKPTIPNSLIPNEALLVLVVFAGALLFSGNPGLQVLSFVGLMGGLGLWAISTSQVRIAKQRQEKWKEEIEEIKLEEEEIRKNRLSRSFKSDDLFVFHEVMRETVVAAVSQNLLEQGAKVQESNEQNSVEHIIPKSKKDIFDGF